MIEVRRFARSDREQLSRLVNAHVAAAVPGGSVPAAALLNDLERPTGEDVIGPWVTELETLVATERERLVAAAHLRRYTADERASEWYRAAGEIEWLLFWPDHVEAGRAMLQAALEQFQAWTVRRRHADGSLPSPGVYGVSDAWPHVVALYEEAGFDAGGGQVELVLVGALDRIPSPAGEPPVAGLELRRRVATLGTAFDGLLDGEHVGSFEVDDDLARGGANLAFAGWADECNNWVREDLRGRGIGSWLLAQAADWLRLGGTSRLMAYVIEHEPGASRVVEYWARHGLRVVNRTTRGWELT